MSPWWESTFIFGLKIHLHLKWIYHIWWETNDNRIFFSSPRFKTLLFMEVYQDTFKSMLKFLHRNSTTGLNFFILISKLRTIINSTNNLRKYKTLAFFWILYAITLNVGCRFGENGDILFVNRKKKTVLTFLSSSAQNRCIIVLGKPFFCFHITHIALK